MKISTVHVVRNGLVVGTDFMLKKNEKFKLNKKDN